MGYTSNNTSLAVTAIAVTSVSLLYALGFAFPILKTLVPIRRHIQPKPTAPPAKLPTHASAMSTVYSRLADLDQFATLNKGKSTIKILSTAPDGSIKYVITCTSKHGNVKKEKICTRTFGGDGEKIKWFQDEYPIMNTTVTNRWVFKHSNNSSVDIEVTGTIYGPRIPSWIGPKFITKEISRKLDLVKLELEGLPPSPT